MRVRMSFGQPSSPQSLLVSRQVFGTSIRAKNVLEIRNTKRRIEPLQPDHRLMCFLGPSGHCMDRGADTHAGLEVRIVLYCHCGPRCRFVIAAQEKMCMRDAALNVHQPPAKGT